MVPSTAVRYALSFRALGFRLVLRTLSGFSAEPQRKWPENFRDEHVLARWFFLSEGDMFNTASIKLNPPKPYNGTFS